MQLARKRPKPAWICDQRLRSRGVRTQRVVTPVTTTVEAYGAGPRGCLRSFRESVVTAALIDSHRSIIWIYGSIIIGRFWQITVQITSSLYVHKVPASANYGFIIPRRRQDDSCRASRPPCAAPPCGRCGRRTGCRTALAGGRRASVTTTRPRTSPQTAPATSQVRRTWQRGARLGIVVRVSLILVKVQ